MDSIVNYGINAALQGPTLLARRRESGVTAYAPSEWCARASSKEMTSGSWSPKFASPRSIDEPSDILLSHSLLCLQ